MTKTFEDVIEAHRLAVGARKVHVTLGPEATPERLEECLAKARHHAAVFGSFRLEERQAAFIARLRKTLRKIDRLARTQDYGGILVLTDMIVDVDQAQDLRHMAAAREKRHEPLPDGASEMLDEIDAQDKDRAAAG
ncbi:hypothetical protein [Paracoccus sp. ME4]|uniref:hypothetical protein n=1 Tax=Paracoccus sp. ME4 TaxID=3138066 RepID=UPI00398ACD3D